jgi:general secretion pathway protein G
MPGFKGGGCAPLAVSTAAKMARPSPGRPLPRVRRSRDNPAAPAWREAMGARVSEERSTAAEREGERGFTLLEILVVIAILGLLIGLVAPAALRQLGGAKVSIAHQEVERIGANLDLYKLDVGSYPTTEQGLGALVEKPADVDNWNGPYQKGAAAPKDPWNHAWIYRSPSTRSGHEYDLCSAGPTGQGTEPGSQDAICNP